MKLHLRKFAFLAVFFLISVSSALGVENEFQIHLLRAAADMENPEEFAFLQELQDVDFRMLAPTVLTGNLVSWHHIRTHLFRDTFVNYSRVKGVMGELYLNTQMRRWVSEHPGTEFIDSYTYDYWNTQGKRPDGLVIRPTPNGVLIEKMLESKMGGGKYDKDQTAGSFRTWQLRGLRLSKDRIYEPSEIFVRAGEEILPISTLHIIGNDSGLGSDFAKIESSVILFVNKGKGPETIEVQETPFTKQTLISFSKRFVAYSWFGAAGTPEQVTQAIEQDLHVSVPIHSGLSTEEEPLEALSMYQLPRSILFPKAITPQQWSEVSQIPARPKPAPVRREENRKPIQTLEELYESEEYLELLDFVKRHSAFPSASTSRRLAHLMSLFGGRTGAFAILLDDELRLLLEKAGNAPALGPFERWLSERDPRDNPELVASMLGTFLRVYNTDHSPLLNRLIQRNPYWAEFFSQRTVEDLRDEDCASRILPPVVFKDEVI